MSAVYKLYLSAAEANAIEFWRGRCHWADACWEVFDTRPQHRDEAPTPRLFFDTEGEAWTWRDACALDTEGGHEMFSGVSDALQKSLQLLYDAIV